MKTTSRAASSRTRARVGSSTRTRLRSPQPTEPEAQDDPVRIVAMTLALETAEALNAPAADRDALISVAMMVGQWLAERGEPGRWDRVKVRELLPLVPFHDRRERGEFVLHLIGLVAHAGATEQIPLSPAQAILADVADLMERDTVIRQFARHMSQWLRAGAETAASG